MGTLPPLPTTPMHTTMIERMAMASVIEMAKAHLASIDHPERTPNYITNMTREIQIMESTLDRFYTN